MDTVPVTLAMVIVSFAIGLLKAGVGVGTGVFTSTFLSLFLEPKGAIPLSSPLMLASDLITTRLYKGKARREIVFALAPPALVGTFLGSQVLMWLDAEMGRLLIGFTAISFVIHQFCHPQKTGENREYLEKTWFVVLTGLLAGVFSGFAHTGGTIVTMYFLLLEMEKEEFIASLAHFLLFLNIIKLAIYFWLGLLALPYLMASVLLIPFLYAGAFIAKNLNRRLSQQSFLHLILVIIWVCGIVLLLKG